MIPDPIAATGKTSMRDMLRRFFTPTADSLWRMVTGQGRHRWHSLWSLIWIVWIFGDLLFDRAVPRFWWPVTLAALAVLLLLFACAHVRPQRDAQWYALGMVVLALLIMPINHSGSGTCVIYGCAYLSLQRDLRRLLLWVVPVLAVWSLQTLVLQWPWEITGWLVLLSLMVAVAQHSMWAGWRRNAELRLTHDEVRRLAASTERERIGRDLHDLLGHTLSMVALKSELAGRLIDRDPAAARHEIADVTRVSREALAQVRNAVSGIRAAALASELASARLLLETSGVAMEYWCDGNELPSRVETCLAMVLREAVTNIQRHAHASRAEITVITGTERVVMRVRDDGRGGAKDGGNGLAGMRERVAACGGELTVESERGHGTSIEVALPLPQTREQRLEAAPATGRTVRGPVASIGDRAGSRG